MSMAKQKVNPILKKELKLGSRSIRLPLSLMFYDIVLAFIAVIAIFSISAMNGLNSYSGDAVDFSGFLYIYQIIGWTQLGITLLIVPILTAGSISGEREKQTLEIMLTTPEKPLSIVWGKLLASLSNFLMFVISSVPIMAIAFVLGGLNWLALLGFIFMIVVVAIFVGSIGIFCSSAFKKTIVSIVMTFLLEFVLLAGPILVFFGILGVGSIVYETIYYDVTNQALIPDLNFGLLPLIMIGNPLTGFFDYMLQTMDISSMWEILKDADIFGVLMPIIAHAWMPMNVIVSAGISFLFLLLAAKKLNPIKNKHTKKKNVAVNPIPPNPIPPQGTVKPQLYQPQTQQLNQTMQQEPRPIYPPPQTQPVPMQTQSVQTAPGAEQMPPQAQQVQTPQETEQMPPQAQQ